MFTRRIFWQLMLAILLIVVGSIVCLTWFGGLSLRQILLDAVRQGGVDLDPSGSSTSMAVVDQILMTFYRRITVGGLLVVSVACVAAFAIARRVSRPLEEIYESTQRLTEGHAETKLAVTDSTEIGALAETINRISLELDERLRTTLRQSREQEAILSSMVEGIVVVDVRRRIVRANAAALRILGSKEAVIGREIGEALSHAALRRVIEAVLDGRGTLEADLTLGGQRALEVEVRANSLLDGFGRPTGALVVLNDRTRIRRLENLRRDFAAHVSHELKTPLTAIKGFADTLLRGALDDPKESGRFVEVIADQAERMERLVEQLLDLARLEKGIECGDIERTWEELETVLEAAVDSLRPQARVQGVEIRVARPEGVVVRANATLLERAVVNLVDNAIRHGGEGTSVRISATQDRGVVIIEVADTGAGISPADCARIFERFYRTKQARGNDPGGSGLGLAFVKHIALAHQGSVEVTSEIGIGSTFRLRIPGY